MESFSICNQAQRIFIKAKDRRDSLVGIWKVLVLKVVKGKIFVIFLKRKKFEQFGSF